MIEGWRDRNTSSMLVSSIICVGDSEVDMLCTFCLLRALPNNGPDCCSSILAKHSNLKADYKVSIFVCVSLYSCERKVRLSASND